MLGADARTHDRTTAWTRVAEDVWQWEDSCTVSAIAGPDGVVVVNAGTGRWLDHLEALPGPVTDLLVTHAFADHAAGARAASLRGIRVLAPETQAEVLADPHEHLRRRRSWLVYDNHWDFAIPVRPVPEVEGLPDYATLTVAGLRVEVLPLPGPSMGHTGYVVTLRDGRRALCCGELTTADAGPVRVAPLQWGYSDLTGAIAAHASAARAQSAGCDLLLPSFGPAVTDGVDDVLRRTRDTYRGLCRRGGPSARSSEEEVAAMLDAPAVLQLAPRVFQLPNAFACVTLVRTGTGRLVAIDFGYSWVTGDSPLALPATAETRRPILHGMDELWRATGAERIDVVLVSHYHDDHVAGIPLLQRLHGTQCWAPESFADVLARPADFALPCTWPQPIHVDRRLPLGESFAIDDVRFELSGPISGHTSFAALIGFEVDGVRYAHTGDQYFWQGWSPGEGHRPWAEDDLVDNHVYRAGARLDGYRRAADWLLGWRPAVVLSGHEDPMRTDDAFFQGIERRTARFQDEHRAAMALGDGQAHFDADSRGGRLEPYRTHLPGPGDLELRAHLRNPLPSPAAVTARLIADEHDGEPVTVQLDGRADGVVTLRLPIGDAVRRLPVGLELEVDGRPYGQVAEALVTVGGPRF